MKRGLGLLAVASLLIVWGSAAAIAAGTGATAAGTSGTAGLAYMTGGDRGSPIVWLANASGGDRRRVGRGDSEILSPNGRVVAVVSSRTTGPDLLIYNASGKRVSTFYNVAKTSVQMFGFSPDSRYLAVGLTNNGDRGGGVGIVDLATGTTRTVGTGYASGGGFSPASGDKLVFSAGPSQAPLTKTNLFTASAASGGATQLTHTNRAFNPVWGKLGIVFDTFRLRGHDDFPVYQLELMNGPHMTQITHTKPSPLQSGLVPFALSADGRHLLASFTGEDTDFAETVDVVTHATYQLKIGEKYLTAGGISSDGRRVLVDAGGFENTPSHGTVESLPFTGGKATVLVRHAGSPTWP